MGTFFCFMYQKLIKKYDHVFLKVNEVTHFQSLVICNILETVPPKCYDFFFNLLVYNKLLMYHYHLHSFLACF